MKTEKMSDKILATLKEKGAVVFVPSGNSMLPFIKNGKSSVVIESATTKPQKFDVILFCRANGKTVLHRVIEFVGEDYVVSGDAQIQTERVKPSQVFGIMQGYYVNEKYIDAKDAKYLKAVEKWYSKKIRRKIRIKFFRLRERVKNIFKKGANKNTDLTEDSDV